MPTPSSSRNRSSNFGLPADGILPTISAMTAILSHQVSNSTRIRRMRATALVFCVAALVGIAAAEEPEKYAVWGAAGVVYDKNELMKHGTWVTGDVIYDKNEGLLFRTDKVVQGNTTDNLFYLAIPEDLAKSFGPMCYRAAENRLKLRLCGAFLPYSSAADARHPNVNFVIWKIHSPSDPDELPPDQKKIFGEHDAIPGYTIVPKKP
jgi:hypothetical protein